MHWPSPIFCFYYLFWFKFLYTNCIKRVFKYLFIHTSVTSFFLIVAAITRGLAMPRGVTFVINSDFLFVIYLNFRCICFLPLHFLKLKYFIYVRIPYMKEKWFFFLIRIMNHFGVKYAGRLSSCDNKFLKSLKFVEDSMWLYVFLCGFFRNGQVWTDHINLNFTEFELIDYNFEPELMLEWCPFSTHFNYVAYCS